MTSYGATRIPIAPARGAAEGRTGGLEVSAHLATGLTLELPLPPSVNEFSHDRTGRPLGNRSKCVQAFWRFADGLIYEQKQWIKLKAVKGLFAIHITWTKAEAGKSDIDNRVKPLLDYLQRIAVIENDKDCRLMVATFGQTNFGCRIMITPWTETEPMEVVA